MELCAWAAALNNAEAKSGNRQTCKNKRQAENRRAMLEAGNVRDTFS
jgi:hypothetical protein